MTRLMKGLDERDKDRGVEQEADSPPPVANLVELREVSQCGERREQTLNPMPKLCYFAISLIIEMSSGGALLGHNECNLANVREWGRVSPVSP